MKRILGVAFCIVLAVPGAVTAATSSPRSVVSLNDMVLLARSDISDQTILTFLDYRELDFALDADALSKLGEAGLSDAVIQYLLDIEEAAYSTSATTDVVPTEPTVIDYPGYYYSSRRYGATLYPLGFYDHHYFGLSYPVFNSYGGQHSIGHGISPIIISRGHRSNLSHVSALGGHQADTRHRGGHRRSALSHSIRSVENHSTRRTGVHSNKHVGSYSRRHGGRHSGGHRGGHSGGHGGSSH